MAHLRISGVHKRYGEVEVLRGIDLDVAQGSVIALLGPSGCGKTTLLRLIAGFEPPDQGHIAFGDTIMASPSVFVPPERRSIGYVPQEGSLFPHLTVEANVRFGLPRQSPRARRVAEVLALTGLEGLGARYPHELSGGQQQRVALARALAPDPTLVLLDEPFNALDLDLRRSICEDVIQVLRRTGTTTVLVSHDPGEAFAVSDQLAVMLSGHIMQCASPETVYWQPATQAVARLTGAAIFLPGQVTQAGVRCALGELPVYPHACPGAPGNAATVMIRPEQVQWAHERAGVCAQVVRRSFRGDHTLVALELGDICLDLRMPSLGAPALETCVSLAVQGACMAWPAGLSLR
ncbi:MAG: ABC transporter ATP-binding protein [Castellaniella sp.]